MGDPMKTGGFGKNPAIDRLDEGSAAARYMATACGLEARVFSPVQLRSQAVLHRRRQIMEESRIDFRRKEQAEDGQILQGRERRVQPGGYPAGDPGYGRAGAAAGSPGRFLPYGRRETGEAVSMGGPAATLMGERRRAADRAADRAEAGPWGDLAGRMGAVGVDRGAVPGAGGITGLSGWKGWPAGGLVPDGHGTAGRRTYQSGVCGQGADGVSDFYLSG